jgi:60 kDa SS-A/Ro ribonucleoprotein
MSMAVRYANHVSNRKTPQREAIPGKKQVKNSAGGHVFAVDCWARLDRFLILGAEGGSYYAGERTLTRENAQAVIECAKENAYLTVERIAEISEAGRAPKNDPAIFALALIAGQLAGLPAASKALEALPRVCRTGTHLFQFISFVKEMRGWGRALRKAVANWYNGKTPSDLAFQVTKYQQREGWSHRDLLRLSHPEGNTPQHNAIFRYIGSGMNELDRAAVVRRLPGDQTRTDHYSIVHPIELPDLIHAVEEAKTVTKPSHMATLIRDEGLVREHVPTHFLNSVEVWEALLEKMPINAMVRNLGKMTNLGLLKPLSAASRLVCSKLTDEAALQKAKQHPLGLLTALKVYEQGHGDKGSLSWQPVSQVVDALNDGFYAAFKAVPVTNKRWLLALDVSGSMDTSTIAGSMFTPRVASAALALVTANVEPNHHIVAFTNGRNYRSMHPGYGVAITPLSISPRQRLNDVVKTVSGLPFGGTDCALPMVYALEQRLEVDCFVIYTDSETWHGDIHPCQALKAYRQAMGIDAKLIVNGMVSNGFSIADPTDRGMLDVVGFDSAVPSIMADFATN